MEIIKTSLAFADGEIFETQKYGECITDKATTIERVKFFLTAFIFRNKLSGEVAIEIKNQKLYVDCRVKPKKFEKELQRKLLARYQVAERDKS
jgi:hypothetical protein